MSLSAIEEYETVLRRFGEVVDFDISSLDRLGIPVTSCSLLSHGRLRHNGNGYGLSVESARLSGLGEVAEGALSAARVAALRATAVRGSRAELVERFGRSAVADPLTLCLPAGSAYSPAMPLHWVPVQRVRTGEQVWVPLEFVASETSEMAGGPALIQPITNGLGAGLDPARPVAHGLLEILQRHTNGLRFRALDVKSAVIEAAELPESVRRLVDALQARGVDPVLKHARTELGVCSTYVMGFDTEPAFPVMLSACGEAAHPSAEVSLTKALLEYANSRARKAFFFGSGPLVRAVAPEAYWDGLDPEPANESRAVAAMAAWRDLSPADLEALSAPDRSTGVSYSDVLVSGVGSLGGSVALATTEALVRYLLDALGDHDVLASPTRVGEVSVAKVIVPGLEVETLSYGRIGELGVRTALADDLDLVRLQDGPSGEHVDRVRLTENAEERLGGPAWYSYAVAERLVGPRYPLYREPVRHSIVFG